jgi:murE/murF fusion protein
MRDAGAQAVAIEASSIGIDQGRLDGVRITVAAFTNLTRDHLDYHQTMERYEQAKARLFVWPGLVAAVLNLDDAAGRRFIRCVPARAVVGYSVNAASEGASLRAYGLQTTPQGQVFHLQMPNGQTQITTSLLGAHNVSNLLLVASVLHTLGCSVAFITRELAAMRPVEGRLQVVDPPRLANLNATPAIPLTVVDYAHTPDALRRALVALRPVARARGGRLICLFGCGGDRDAGKRAEMGRIAAELADSVNVTSDNPRSEDPAAIIAQICAGIPVGTRLMVEVDRARAMMRTIWSATPADVVLVAGKGHETYQEVGGHKLPFDDREWARLALLLPCVKSVSIDTRQISPNELFVALVGEHFDGHDYLFQAQAGGACAAVVAQRVPSSPLPQLVLGDTHQALRRMGAAWRARFDLPVIAVTGSNGKTTTKEMMAAILADWQGEQGRLATVGNLNNDIGVPLTLLRLNAQHRVAVLELGMNHPGEIDLLAGMVAPTVAVVTNAQREHQEFMHTVEAVARENGATVSALPENGVAVYPGDDSYTALWDQLAVARRVLRFGLHPGLEVYAEAIELDAHSTRCRVTTPAGNAELHLSLPGLHNLRNALAAIAGTLAVGAPLASAIRALASFSAVAGRMQRRPMSDGTLLIDDTYNANPDSVRAAIDVLAPLPAPRVLVLGDMGEVGANGAAMHREVGQYARERGLDAMITLGEASRSAAAAFGDGASACVSVDEVAAVLRDLQPSSVLVKGSRFMRMERVVQAFSIAHNKTVPGQRDDHVA